MTFKWQKIDRNWLHSTMNYVAIVSSLSYAIYFCCCTVLTALTAADVVVFVFRLLSSAQNVYLLVYCAMAELMPISPVQIIQLILCVCMFIVCILFASYRSHRKHIISYNSFGFRFFFFFFIQSLRFFLRPSRFFTLCLSLDSLHARYLYYLWLQSF